MDKHLRDRLVDGVIRLGLTISEPQIALLLGYRDMLERWNKAYNLTAIRDPMDQVVRHLLDSLAIAPHLEGKDFVDVGTGPGLPGVPLAILQPEQRWWLLDSNGKKTRFLFQVKSQLGLSNIDIVESRVETWQPGRLFDGVVTRAFADIHRTCEQCRHLLAETSRLYAMKSALVETELAQLGDDFTLHDKIALSVPGMDEPRWLTALSLSPHRGSQ